MVLNDDDHDLIVGLKANDEMYQNKLVDRHSGYFLSFAISKGLTREDALEVVNDVFYKVILHINDFDPNRGSKFKTWMFQIAKNSIIDKLRTTKQTSFEKDFQLFDEKYTRVDEDNWQRSDFPKSDGSVLSTSLLLEVLDELNETDKKLVLERSYDVPFKEIAISIGKTENATKVAYHRALEKLKKAYIAKIESQSETTKVVLKTYLKIGGI